jgi:hypothetical protein
MADEAYSGLFERLASEMVFFYLNQAPEAIFSV